MVYPVKQTPRCQVGLQSGPANLYLLDLKKGFQLHKPLPPLSFMRGLRCQGLDPQQMPRFLGNQNQHLLIKQ